MSDTLSLRAPMRDDDPRARAAARAAELREHGVSEDDGSDQFFIPQEDIPDGWCYEWKRDTTLGKEDPSYQVTLARAGWLPVPVSRHPSYMPKGYEGATIMRQGMVLMELPLEIVAEKRDKANREARLQVRQKEMQLGAAPEGQFQRSKSSGESLLKLNKTYEPMAVPEE